MDDESQAVDDASENWVVRFVGTLIEKYGDAVQAILLYGSYARGERDTVLDFYVLFDRYEPALKSVGHRIANRVLPPNVYHLSLDEADGSGAAKYATITLDQFEGGIIRRFHSYFWARFAQPVTIVYANGLATRERITTTIGRAQRRMIGSTLPMLGGEFSIEELWITALTLTYGCELRPEDRAKARELFNAYKAQLTEITMTNAPTLPMSKIGEDCWRSDISRGRRGVVALSWRIRKIQGKLLSIARLFKAAFTFNDPLDYVIWKVERHSGVHVEPTNLQRRHPLVFAWGLIWRLYRLGGFK